METTLAKKEKAGKVLSEAKYARLVKDIRSLIAEGRERAQKAAGQELARTYWEIGKRITEENLASRASYGDSVLADLGEELGVDDSTLRDAILFFNQNQISLPREGNLTWSHHRQLIRIQNESVRGHYQKAAAKENWTRDQLASAIKRGEHQKQLAGPKSAKKLNQLTRPTEPTYVYKAWVERVIDGDTLIMRVDLGFQVHKEQRFRLAEIDCPAMDEPGGKEAYRYVRDRLAQLEFVMVRTNKIDIYGRYVAHVFYLPNEESKDKIFNEGRHLNQELLDKGLAKRV